MKNSNLTTNLIVITTLATIIIGGGFLVTKAYDRNMVVYCNKLLKQAEENKYNPHFFIRDIDDKECREYGVILKPTADDLMTLPEDLMAL